MMTLDQRHLNFCQLTIFCTKKLPRLLVKMTIIVFQLSICFPLPGRLYADGEKYFLFR